LIKALTLAGGAQDQSDRGVPQCWRGGQLPISRWRPKQPCVKRIGSKTTRNSRKLLP